MKYAHLETKNFYRDTSIQIKESFDNFNGVLSDGLKKIGQILNKENKDEPSANTKKYSVESSSDDSDNEEKESLPLQYSEIPSIYLKSKSIPHFATLLAERIFKPSELRGDVNVYGRSIYGEKKKV
ncbi:unnamed protein product [Brachionus calyciflorus]|uniref:Uncharacterized protein n=1 Tax=Brachionus calyciflorus TaxID=104777 RepID=A0A814NAS4_9BILA|nr:unnamed protein product [Brachionus calyciflorus]